MATTPLRDELQALLDLQESDLKIADLERELEGLLPRIRDLERKRQEQAEAVARSEAALAVEDRRKNDLERRIAHHTQLLERNLAQLETVRNEREASAATTQVDVARRIIGEDEQELKSTRERIAGMQADLNRARDELALLDMEIEAAQAEVNDRRTAIEVDLGTARGEREGKATRVSRLLLAKYDRIRGRRTHAVFPVRGQSCGHCDTAVPLHRRSQMQSTGGIEVCEACGVLLYVAVGVSA